MTTKRLLQMWKCYLTFDSPHAQGAQEQVRRRGEGPNGDRVVHQIEGLGGVHRGHPDQAAPANVVARAVVLNVHAAPVAGLPPEKLGDVNQLEHHLIGQRKEIQRERETERRVKSRSVEGNASRKGNTAT